MQTYEFNTIVRDGLIHVPEQLTDKKLSHVKVILFADSAKNVFKPRKNRFTAMRLKTKGFTFNRNEIHERQSFS